MEDIVTGPTQTLLSDINHFSVRQVVPRGLLPHFRYPNSDPSPDSQQIDIHICALWGRHVSQPSCATQIYEPKARRQLYSRHLA